MAIKQQDRIVLIDALRGYALMGLFLIHMVEYFELYWYAPTPDPINTWMFNIFGGKAYAIFSTLFGLSFYIILQRNAERGTDFRLRFLWRLILLLAIGYLHGLIYSGEVLQVLAVAGFILLPLWRAPGWLVLSISALLLMQTTTHVFIAWIGNSDLEYAHQFFVSIQIPVYEKYAHGSFIDVITANAWGGTSGKWAFMLETGRFANIVGLSTLGFWLGRSGFFTNLARYGRTYFPLLIVAILGAAACHYGADLFKLLPHAEKMDDSLMEVLDTYFNTFLTFASILAFILLYQNKILQRALGLLAAPGRMTLSFYVLQSLVCVPFFYGFGLGAYRYIGQLRSLLLGLALWILQVVVANWWIKRFQYGPLEWCWRAATYTTTDIAFRKKVSAGSA